MSSISDRSLNTTIHSLQEYAKNQTDPDKDGPRLLKLVSKNGEKVLVAIPRNKMSLGDWIISSFGFGGYKLAKIAKFLQSDEFCSALDHKELLPTEFKSINEATTYLDQKIAHHNKDAWFDRFRITANLTAAISPHLHLLATQILRKEPASPKPITDVPVPRKEPAPREVVPEKPVTRKEPSPPKDIPDSPIIAKIVPLAPEVAPDKLRAPEVEPITPAPDRAISQPNPALNLVMDGRFKESKEAFQLRPLNTAGCSELLNAAFRQFEPKLAKDLRQGAAIFTSDNKVAGPSWLQEFHELYAIVKDSLSRESVRVYDGKYNQIINRAFVQKEIDKIERKLVAKESYVVEAALRLAYGRDPKNYPDRETILKLQATGLQVMLEKDHEAPYLQNLKPAALKSHVEGAKLDCLILGCGIPVSELPKYRTMIEHMEKEWTRCSEIQQRYLDDFRHDCQKYQLPPLASSYLQSRYQSSLESAQKQFFRKVLKEYSSVVPTHEKMKTEMENACRAKRESMQPRFDFYVKWKKNLKAEMKQGFVNEGEALGDGVCWALSLRWTVVELKKSPLVDVVDMCNEMKIGTVDERDRFNQALYQRGEAGEKEKIKKEYGIKKTELLMVGVDIASRELLDQKLNQFFDSELWIANQGVGQLSFDVGESAHAISVVCVPDKRDQTNSVFRIGDPNFGIFSFQVSQNAANHHMAQRQFIECLGDLLMTIYSKKFQFIVCECFEV